MEGNAHWAMIAILIVAATLCVVDAHWPTIIPTEVFYAAQSLLKSNMIAMAGILLL
jgi:hypothetical protein